MAATSDHEDDVSVMMKELGLTFPVAYGVNDSDFAGLGAWWNEDHHGYYIQPTELLISRGGVIFGSLYASGPVGRMAVDEVMTAIRSRESTRSA